MLDDASEEGCVSQEIARMERRGIEVASIEHGAVEREASIWGWGKAPSLFARTTWIVHLGGALKGGSVTFRQSVWTFEPSPDPRDAGKEPRRWSLEIMPDSPGTALGLKRRETAG